MEKALILAVGTNQPIMRTLKRLIDKNPKWEASLAFSVNEALALCQAQPFALVLLGAGTDLADRQLFQSYFKSIGVDIPIVMHYGGGSGLLLPEIHEGLKEAQKHL